MTDVLRKAAEADDRSIFALARDADIPYPVMYRFLKGDKTGHKWGLNLTTADKLAEAVGLELRPKKKGQR
ncbi:hypothetical protein LCGC14_1701430 [marine sediment metagenome]|uniref:HTH cro/C1-type domain-containing protein n=1 Tax=marine sediment metagenome TaxID=412755 RepID=A0A0F9JYA8_9ZZZZ